MRRNASPPPPPLKPAMQYHKSHGPSVRWRLVSLFTIRVLSQLLNRSFRPFPTSFPPAVGVPPTQPCPAHPCPSRPHRDHLLVHSLLQLREYWMIYRGPGLLDVVWFGSSPILDDMKGGRKGLGGGAKSYDPKEILVLYKSFNILCSSCFYAFPPIFLMGGQKIRLTMHIRIWLLIGSVFCEVLFLGWSYIDDEMIFAECQQYCTGC